MADEPKQHRILIGGPGTWLPYPLESLLSWLLCFACLTISGYHYCVVIFVPPLTRWRRQLCRTQFMSRATTGNGMTEKQRRRRRYDKTTFDDELPYLKCWIPLTTHSRAELDGATPRVRLDQLMHVLNKLMGDDDGGQKICQNDETLVNIIRSNDVCRHLASLAMRPFEKKSRGEGAVGANNTKATITTTLYEELPDHPLVKTLARLWPMFLVLPLPSDTSSSVTTSKEEHAPTTIEISLIIPVFRDNAILLERKLQRAHKVCHDPQSVEVILVDAGGCSNNDMEGMSKRQRLTQWNKWGRVEYVRFVLGGGRGPCLNFGASIANGRILTFCHSDTILPEGWDNKIQSQLLPTTTCHKTCDKNGSTTVQSVKANSCAFSFGIDTSPEGLNGGPFPPGIRAVETTANIRTRLYSLPYGDQVLSVPTSIFRLIGGFPDQCLMEDYELVALLRMRSVVMPKLLGIKYRERLTIIEGDAAFCSPKRWQTFGVLYVTFMNSKFVKLYTSGGLKVDDLYQLYYGTLPPKRKNTHSPWEEEMQKILL